MTLSLLEIIKEKTRENNRLKEQLDYILKKQALGIYLK
jgi:hypothetical protein